MGALNICITGNIASGKTTLTQLVSQQLGNAGYVPEPYEENPFLPLYLQDKKRWGFASTLHYFGDYVRKFAEVTSEKNYRYHFVDAGTWTNRLVYGEYLYHEQFITPDEYRFYHALCDLIEKEYRHPPADGFIFVNASPQTCWQRMKRRGWNFQTSTIELSYLEMLNRYFDAMQQTVMAQKIPLLKVPSDVIDYTQPQGQQEVLGRIEGFLQSYQRPDS